MFVKLCCLTLIRVREIVAGSELVSETFYFALLFIIFSFLVFSFKLF